MSAPRASHAELASAGACLMIANGALLLSLQVDDSRALHGTGWSGLAVGGLITLLATTVRISSGHFPRALVAQLSSVFGFVGQVFLIAAVLVPSGPWLLLEALLFLVLFSWKRRGAVGHGPEFSSKATWILAPFLLFRLWLVFQASRGEFAIAAIDVPLLSSIPFEFLRPWQRIHLGQFTWDELVLPPYAGLALSETLVLWMAGFVLCAKGLEWRAAAARELEDDRVHAAIEALPSQVAQTVAQRAPEQLWSELGLHGLSQRRLAERLKELAEGATNVAPAPPGKEA